MNSGVRQFKTFEDSSEGHLWLVGISIQRLW